MPHCITSLITQKMRLLFSSLFLAGFFALLNSGTAVGEDWPTWLGPRRDCSSLETLKPWIDAPKVLWKLPIGEGHSSPVIHAGKVYLHSRVKDKDEEVLTCFEASSGKQLWATPYKRAAFTSVFGLGPRATPSISDRCIFTFGVTGILSSFNLADGKINWQVDTLTKFKAANLYFGTSCSPLLVDDKIVVEVGGKGASIVAFNQKDGTTAWQTLDDKSSYSSPTLWKDGDKQMILALTQQGLVALDPKDGKSHWKFPLVDRLNESSTTPVRMGNMVLASSVTYGSVALNLNNSEAAPSYKQAWKNGSLNCYFATPVVVGRDHVYIVTGGLLPPPQSDLQCVEIATGKIIWTKKKVGKYHASLVRTADNKILMLEDFGSLVMFEPDASGYKEICRAKVCGHTWAHPAVSEGRVFLRDEKELLCVDLNQSSK